MWVLMSWKLQLGIIVFLPLAILELYVKPEIKIDLRFTYIRKIGYMVFASLMYLIWFMGLLEACRNSIILHALLLNNLGIFIAPIVSIITWKHSGLLQHLAFLMGIFGILL